MLRTVGSHLHLTPGDGRRPAVMIGAIALFALGCGATTGPGSEEIPFEVLAQTRGSAHWEGSEFRVVRSKVELGALWEVVQGGLHPRPEPPSIDFERQTVLAYFMGGRGTGGYSVEVERVIATPDLVLVHLLEWSPGRRCVVTLSLTSPAVVVAVDRVDVAAEPRVRARTVPCR